MKFKMKNGLATSVAMATTAFAMTAFAMTASAGYLEIGSEFESFNSNYQDDGFMLPGAVQFDSGTAIQHLY